MINRGSRGQTGKMTIGLIDVGSRVCEMEREKGRVSKGKGKKVLIGHSVWDSNRRKLDCRRKVKPVCLVEEGGLANW